MNGHDSSGPDGASTDRDLRLWLVSKLEDKWPKLVTLNRDVLQAAVQIFQTLEAPLKVKLLFACIMAKNDMPVHDLLHNLFEVAKKDDDEWVRVVASLLCTHETGVLNFDYLLENPTSKAVLEKLKEVGMYPIYDKATFTPYYTTSLAHFTFLCFLFTPTAIHSHCHTSPVSSSFCCRPSLHDFIFHLSQRSLALTQDKLNEGEIDSTIPSLSIPPILFVLHVTRYQVQQKIRPFSSLQSVLT